MVYSIHLEMRRLPATIITHESRRISYSYKLIRGRTQILQEKGERRMIGADQEEVLVGVHREAGGN